MRKISEGAGSGASVFEGAELTGQSLYALILSTVLLVLMVSIFKTFGRINSQSNLKGLSG